MPMWIENLKKFFLSALRNKKKPLKKRLFLLSIFKIFFSLSERSQREVMPVPIII